MHKQLEHLLKRHFGSLDAIPDSLDGLIQSLDAVFNEAHDSTGSETAVEEKVRLRTAELMAINTALERQIAVGRIAELALKESEQRAQILAAHSPIGIIHSDAQGKTLYVNQKWCEITGVSVEEALGQELHLPTRGLGGLGGGAKGATPEGEREFCIERSHGRDVWVVEHAAALYNEHGRITGYVGMLTDITERRAAEEAIRQSEEQYRTLFEESRDTIYVTSPEGRILDVNPAGVELLGYSSKEEMLKLDVNDHVYSRSEDRQRFLEAISRQGFINDIELELKRKDGEPLIAFISATAVRDENGNLIAIRGILRDVTQQRQLERRLRQALKWEAVGRLAGGVAHDFNNLLTAVIGYSDLIALSTRPGDPVHQHSQEIIASARKGGELTRQLLALSRRQVLSPKVLKLNQVIADMRSLLNRMIGDDIDLVLNLEAQPDSILVDPSQLEQIVFNLTLNARDAMPEGGTLTLETSHLCLPDSATHSPVGMEPGNYIVFAVRDTGVGIDEEIQDQVFEPFFTTKEGGTGTGLGLAMVYAIVQRNGGQIEVESRPGEGTLFKLYLPQKTTAPQPAAQAPAPSTLPEGKETILLVEDESAVRTALAQFLRRQGYQVLTAANGQEGLDTATGYDGPIDLLLSDVVMPKMNGIELTRHLKEGRPDLKVLLISGYTDKGQLGDVIEDPLCFLPKPFNTKILARRLRQLFERTREEDTPPTDLGTISSFHKHRDGSH